MKIPCFVGAMAVLLSREKGGRYLAMQSVLFPPASPVVENALIGTDGHGLLMETALIRIGEQKNNDETMKRPCSYAAMAGGAWIAHGKGIDSSWKGIGWMGIDGLPTEADGEVDCLTRYLPPFDRLREHRHRPYMSWHVCGIIMFWAGVLGIDRPKTNERTMVKQ